MKRLFWLVLLLALTASVQAQLKVELKIKRRSLIRYEPVLATVTITNLSGRVLMLQDGESQWFGFQILNGTDIVPPINPDYHLDPLELQVGESVKRTVNLNSLFSLGELGNYRIKAVIFSATNGKFYTSNPDLLTVTEGRVIWQQSVGVPAEMPNAGATHTISMLSFQGENTPHLYARVENRETGTVFCTYQLGILVDSQPPQVQLDSSNNAYVLQNVGPKAYILSKIGINGEFHGRTNYDSVGAAPYLRRQPSGELQIVGAKRALAQTPAPAQSQPSLKLSDRPPGLPKP